ncbi:MAG: indole-3-glycerol-phosphate synthase [Actinomycetota bacterium]
MLYLAELVAAARTRAEALRAAGDDALRRAAAAASGAQPFAAALREAAGSSLIAEIKRATPSRGALDLDLDAGRQAAAYARGGAVAISVLTEPRWFCGSLADLAAAATAGLPLLRKDFIVEDVQLLESRAAGADAVLLIVRALGPELPDLIDRALELGMEPLVEVHDERDVERALHAGAALIGVNHRDLETFEVDPDRTAKLAPLLPPGTTVVALSGVSARAEVEALEAAGAHAVLVGEALVRAPDPASALRLLRGVA